jgi:hypothetical protein
MISCMYKFSISSSIMAIVFCISNFVCSEQQATSNGCFSHEDCLNPSDFCAWVQCQNDDGTTYNCGRCRPCSLCLCNTNATDFECPSQRCPSQPAYGVKFWQGVFYNSTPLRIYPNVTCVLRFAVFGNMFSILQIPVPNNHPAESATLNIPISSECQGFARSGVMHSSAYESNGVYSLNMIISSEGSPASPLRSPNKVSQFNLPNGLGEQHPNHHGSTAQ